MMSRLTFLFPVAVFSSIFAVGCGEGEEDGGGGSGAGASSSGGSSMGGGATGSGGAGMGGDTMGTGGNGTGGGMGTGGMGNGLTCDEIACLDTQTCNEDATGAWCECLPGHAGPQCQADYFCSTAASPCGATGICKDSPGGFWCDCKPGYAYDGEDCVAVDECDVAPCATGASCVDGDGTFSCTCPGGQFGNGQFCKGSDSCAGECANGTCVNTQTGFTCECDNGYSGATSCSSCATIDVEDALADAIRAQVGLADGATITPASVAGFNYLSAQYSGVTSLAGLECWPNLKTLQVGGNSIDNAGIANLDELNALETLDISCNAVTNLSVLEEHPSLSTLIVNHDALNCDAAVTTPGDISSILLLEHLELRGHGFTTSPDLSDLTRLAHLDISMNDLTTVTGLATLSRLSTFYAFGNASLSNVSALSGLSSLRKVDVSRTSVGVLTAFSGLSQLSQLGASGNGLTTLTPLSGLTSLRELYVSSNNLDSVSPVGALELQLLDISGNQVATLKPLADGKLQGSVSINENPLPCETEQQYLDTLTGRGVIIYGMCRMNP